MAWPVKSVLALISLPIFTICAFTLYYYQIKDREWKRYLKNIQKQEIEIKVPLESVGSLIGRGGQKIKELQERTQTKISFKNSRDDDRARICRIFGAKENVEQAKTLILEIVHPKDIETFEMWVAQNSCGRIIGRCGDNIRAIQRSSQAQIKIDTLKLSNSKVLITIKGKPNEIAAAKELIEEKVQEALISEVPRSPRSRVKNHKGNGVAMNKIPQYEKITPTTSDGMAQVYVSSVASPHHFWLQLCSPRGIELDHLVDDMTEYYSKPENQKLHKLKEVKKGQIVASKFQHDGKWYRVEVFSVEVNQNNPDESQVDVFYVDYGDSAFFPLGELLELKPEYLRLKFQAIEASLIGILPKGDDWDEEAIEIFSDMVYSAQWKELLAQVLCYKEAEKTTRKETIPFVKLYDPDGPPGVDIASQFIEKGFALRDENAELPVKVDEDYDDDDDDDDDEGEETWPA